MDLDFVIKRDLMRVFQDVKDKLTTEDVKYIEEEINCGECGVAYEDLCVQLYEYTAPLSQKNYDELVEIGKMMHIKEKYWLTLKELVASRS